MNNVRKVLNCLVLCSALCVSVVKADTQPTQEVPVLDSNTGAKCFGYAGAMQTEYKSKRYKAMSEYYGLYFDRLQSQEYGTKNADIMVEYFYLGVSHVKHKVPRADNLMPKCEAIFDKYNKGNPK